MLRMDREEIAQGVRKIIMDELGLESIASVSDDATLEGLGADSLDGVEVLMVVEEKYDVKLDVESEDRAYTTKDIIDQVYEATRGEYAK